MIDHVPERLELARQHGDAELINFDEVDVSSTLDAMTGGRGPDCCIDAVGLETHGHSIDAIYDRVKQSVMLATDRIHALRQAIYCCRKGGTVSVPGVYGGFLDKLPFGAAFAKGLKFAMRQTHVRRYTETLLKRIQGNGAPGFDPSYIISHRFSLDDAPHAYKTFNEHKGDCTKVVFTTGA